MVNFGREFVDFGQVPAIQPERASMLSGSSDTRIIFGNFLRDLVKIKTFSYG